MKIRYRDLIEQTFDWPQTEFDHQNDQLTFHGIPMLDLAKEFGTPLKFTYIPKIGQNIDQMRKWFKQSMKKLDYPGEYHYCYVSKSGHFRHILSEVIAHGAHLETSSTFDLDIIKALCKEGKIDKSHRVICNGFKTQDYISKIGELLDDGYTGLIPIIDNAYEFSLFRQTSDKPVEIGIRIASEEEPKFEFYTSRLGIRYKDITRFYMNQVHDREDVSLKMLHFFVNTGIRDTAYYWNELNKCLNVYCELAKVCPTLDSLNIGGGFPFKNSLAFDFDYKYMIEQILEQIKLRCESEGVNPPHIYTEFGSYTVAESGGVIYKVLYQKQQNDREKWNIINSSFMTTLPDTWAISAKFISMPIHRWDDEYERVFLGGITCDSEDYYNSEQHINAIYMPVFDKKREMFIGFFHTGAYQESIGGYGGIHHCLIPQPRHILIDRDEEDNLTYKEYSPAQKAEDMLSILGYNK
jgi:arginine decarboxylase